MIVVDELTKVFPDKKKGQIHAVSRLSFRAEPGRIYGLLGANGAGKTTTLRMLATLLKPTSGNAVVGGADLARDPAEVRRRIGFLSTATALYGRLTAREQVQYFGQLHGLPDSTLHTRIDALFDRLGIHDFATRRCDKLSTGQKQRVSIARTLVHDPAVMIFDEPTLGLDIFSARTILQFIRECRDAGKTVLFSTHVMAEVERLCDQVGIIHAGRLQAQGTVQELRERYSETDLEEVFIKAVGSSAVAAASA